MVGDILRDLELLPLYGQSYCFCYTIHHGIVVSGHVSIVVRNSARFVASNEKDYFKILYENNDNTWVKLVSSAAASQTAVQFL